MNRLQLFLELTETLEHLLEQEFTPDNRDSIIEEVSDLVVQRSNQLIDISPPFTAEEKQTGAHIVAKNHVIQKRMDVLFSDLKWEMKQIQQRKKSNQTYTNPYGNVRPSDGMFLDSKK